jgi:hypothetical protein
VIRNIVIVVYVVVGVIVANTNDYFQHLGAVKPIVSAVLAVVAWPAVLLGANLHL